MIQPIFSWASAALVVVTFSTPLLAEPPGNVLQQKKAPSKFIRIVKDDDGPTALEMMSAHRPDILVSEMALPRMDGCQLARHVRRQTRFKNMLLIVRGQNTGAVLASATLQRGGGGDVFRLGKGPHV